MKFNITNVSDKKLEISLIDRPDGLFDIDLPSSVEAGKSAQGTIKLHDDAIEESFEKSVTLELNDEEKSRFTIPIKRTMRRPGDAAMSSSSSGH